MPLPWSAMPCSGAWSQELMPDQHAPALSLLNLQSSGGVYNGANPPAFDRNRRKEMAELLALPEPEGGCCLSATAA